MNSTLMNQLVVLYFLSLTQVLLGKKYVFYKINVPRAILLK
jgi:hypothetical protein